MIDLINVEIAIADVSFFAAALIFVHIFAEVYDWWYSRKKHLSNLNSDYFSDSFKAEK